MEMGITFLDIIEIVSLWILERLFLNKVFTDSDEVYKLVKTVNKDTASEQYFLSVLQHLLLIRDDVYAR